MYLDVTKAGWYQSRDRQEVLSDDKILDQFSPVMPDETIIDTGGVHAVHHPALATALWQRKRLGNLGIGSISNESASGHARLTARPRLRLGSTPVSVQAPVRVYPPG